MFIEFLDAHSGLPLTINTAALESFKPSCQDAETTMLYTLRGDSMGLRVKMPYREVKALVKADEAAAPAGIALDTLETGDLWRELERRGEFDQPAPQVNGNGQSAVAEGCAEARKDLRDAWANRNGGGNTELAAFGLRDLEAELARRNGAQSPYGVGDPRLKRYSLDTLEEEVERRTESIARITAEARARHEATVELGRDMTLAEEEAWRKERAAEPAEALKEGC